MCNQALLAVSFGTSHLDTLEKTITAIEGDLAQAFSHRIGLGELGGIRAPFVNHAKEAEGRE